MSHFFVSYSRKDAPFIKELTSRLHQAGLDTWVDSNRLKAGREWRDAIDDAIRGSDALIVVMTPNARKSEYVTYEWAFAYGIGLRIIPILLERTDLHPRLAVLQFVDFTSHFELNHAWDHLVELLNEVQKEVLREKANVRNKSGLLEGPFVQATPLLFERLGIPAVILEGDGAYEYHNTKSPQSLQYLWDPSSYTLDDLPDELAVLCKKVFQERADFANRADKPLYNGRHARVIDYQPLRDDRTGFKGVRLRLQETDYYTFLSTNHAMESALSSEVSRSTLYSAEAISVRNLRNSLLANALTVSANIVVESSDNLKYLLVQKRNISKVTHSFSTWQCSAAGSVNMPADTSTAFPSPFFSAVVREVKEETGISLQLSEVFFLALIRDTRYFEPALIAQATIEANPKSVLQQIEDSFESEGFELLLLTPESCANFLIRNGREFLKRKRKKVSGLNERQLVLAAIDDYAATAIAALALTLLHEFGSVSAVEEVFRVS